MANARIVSTQQLSGLGAVRSPDGTASPDVMAVVLVDGSGNILKSADNGDGTATFAISGGTGGGGGGADVQYIEDSPSVDGELLNMAGVVRKDTRASMVSADGDRTELQVNPSGDVRVEVSSVAGTAVDVNSGSKSAGTLRVVLATDQPALTAALKVDGSAVTQPVSNATLPLPTGAATAAKQPALGTAGTASVDVLTVQGVTGMTALKVDGSAATQPVSGTVTASTPASTTNAVALTGADQVVSATAKDYRGVSIRETTGTTAAVVRIYDNATTNTGTIIEEIGLAPAESAREYYSPGVKTANGIFVKIVSGTVSGSVRTA